MSWDEQFWRSSRSPHSVAGTEEPWNQRQVFRTTGRMVTEDLWDWRMGKRVSRRAMLTAGHRLCLLEGTDTFQLFGKNLSCWKSSKTTMPAPGPMSSVISIAALNPHPAPPRCGYKDAITMSPLSFLISFCFNFSSCYLLDSEFLGLYSVCSCQARTDFFNA